MLSLPGVLTLLRLSGFDADLFSAYKDVILRAVRQARSGGQQYDLLYDLEQVRDHILFLNPARDVCFELARVYMGLGEFQSAAELFEDSLQYVSEHHVTWHNLGICAVYLQDYERAVACFSRVRTAVASDA